MCANKTLLLPEVTLFRAEIALCQLGSPLDCKEIQPVHPKEISPVLHLISAVNTQHRVLIGGTDAEAETPVLWPPDAKS